MSSLEFRTSQYGFVGADGLAQNGGVVILDSTESYSGVNYTTKAPGFRVDGGSLTITGAGNITFSSAPVHDQTADPYAYWIKRTSTGRVYFSKPGSLSPCWFGAVPTGSFALGDEVATTNAHIDLSFACHGAGPYSVCVPPPGVFAASDGTGKWLNILSMYLRFIAESPLTVRYDWDNTTILPDTVTPFVTIGLFAAGDPTTGTLAGEKNPAFIGGANASCPGFSFVGAYKLTTVELGFVWKNIDWVKDPTGIAPLPTNTFWIPIYRFASFEALIEDCWFIGTPCDGFNIWGGSGRAVRVSAAFCGYYGGPNTQGQLEGSTTRNSFTIAGWQDLLTPGLTANKITIEDCRSICAADSGFAVGAFCDHVVIANSTETGSNDACEFILFNTNGFTEWRAGASVAVNDLMYVNNTTPPGGPANLGGLVFQCTTAGTTGSTAPTGTVGQQGIIDGSVTWQCIGNMPANGRVACTVEMNDVVLDGAFPASVMLPYGLGLIAKPPSITQGGNGLNAGAAIAMNSSNEGYWYARGLKIRNYGIAGLGYGPVGCNIFNGGRIDVEAELENCYRNPAVGIVGLSVGVKAFGKGPNNEADVRLRLTFRNSQGDGSSYLCMILGNLNRYDIEVDYDNSPNNASALYVDHANTAPSTFERGRVSLRGTGLSQQPLHLYWSYGSGSSIAGAIDVEGCRTFGSNSSGQSGGMCLIEARTSSSIPGSIRFHDNAASYAGKTSYPIVMNPTITGGLDLEILNNRFNEGSWKLNYALSGTVTVLNPAATPRSLIAYNNGLPGDMITDGTATPSSGTWRQGDLQKRTNIGSGGDYTVYDVCGQAGTLGGSLPTGFTITVSGTTDHGTYTGSPPPPLPGQVINITGGSQNVAITRADSGVIYFETNVSPVTNAGAAYAAPTFKKLTAN